MSKPLSIAIVGAGPGRRANTWLRSDADPGWVYGYDACNAPLGA